MATMIPDKVQSFKTEGEKCFYQFLKNVAKPDTQYVVWYSPDLDNKEPDFVLYSKKAGIVIFEVKDWSLDQIVEANSHNFKIKFGSKIKTITNPLQQASGYMYQLIDILTKDGRLVSKDPAYFGKPIVPLSCGVVFSNINKYEYQEKAFNQVISTNKAFFWDDLYPQSDICQDPSGNCFADIFDQQFSPLFPFCLSGKDMDHLKHLIFPSVRIQLPERSKQPYPVRCSRLQSLDNHQEAIARKYESGHHILCGPPGCGKTLILVQKAASLLKYNSSIKSILFVCFNITLVNYIKRLISHKNLPLGENGIKVTHFFQLCADILGESVEFENESSDYYDVILQTTLEKLKVHNIHYDAVMVDEGQDFSSDMYQIITALLNRKTNNLTIAFDENQNLYNKNFKWLEVGIQARGRVHNVSYVYRNTKQLSRFASMFIAGNSNNKMKVEQKQKSLFPEFF
jgi:hypothetical protein